MEGQLGPHSATLRLQLLQRHELVSPPIPLPIGTRLQLLQRHEHVAVVRAPQRLELGLVRRGDAGLQSRPWGGRAGQGRGRSLFRW